MSLVGSLEDLGLADILQIVSLARKSGRLLLRSDGDAGRIILRDGLVRGAAIKGDRDDLRGLLVAGGVLDAAVFERASERAAASGMTLDEAVVETAELPRDRLESLRRKHVEASVMRMFGWRTGEFSFEVRDDVDPEDAELLLPSGINTQYLAMEATRLRDEGGPSDGLHTADGFEDADAPMFSGEAGAEDVDAVADGAGERSLQAATDAMALATAQSVDETDEDDDTSPELEPVPEPPAEPPPGPEPPAEIPVATSPSEAAEVAVEVAPAPPADPIPAARTAGGPLPPLVAVDADLSALEWLKAQASPRLPRVHIFQKLEGGLERVRQYLARGVVPLVALSPQLVESDRSADVDLRRRLRSLAPGMTILALVEEGPGDAPPAGYDDVLVRPAAPGPDPEYWGPHQGLADAMCATLERAGGRVAVRGRGAPAPSISLSRLKSVSDRLRDPSRREDVLALVLEFASEMFARVAIFMVQEDAVVGMASRGVGPDEGVLAGLELRGSELPEPFRASLEGRGAARGSLDGRSARRLVEALGAPPAEAYVAPIESGTCVAALLYADPGPGLAGIGDTTPLEIVLHEAGLALDRTLLERALADAEGRR